MIDRDRDLETGIIVVTGSGEWAFSDIAQHYVALRDMIADMRTRDEPVRVLSDVTRGQRQAAWVEDYIKDQMEQTFFPGDRVAILTATQEDKEHVPKRLVTALDIWAFSSRLAAEHWLLYLDEDVDSSENASWLPCLCRPPATQFRPFTRPNSFGGEVGSPDLRSTPSRERSLGSAAEPRAANAINFGAFYGRGDSGDRRRGD